MVLGAVAILLLVRRIGDTLSAPAPDVARLTTAASTSAAQSVLLHLLVALTAVVVVGQLLGRLFAAIGQPPVIGEVVGGVVLGPSFRRIIPGEMAV